MDSRCENPLTLCAGVLKGLKSCDISPSTNLVSIREEVNLGEEESDSDAGGVDLPIADGRNFSLSEPVEITPANQGKKTRPQRSIDSGRGAPGGSEIVALLLDGERYLVLA